MNDFQRQCIAVATKILNEKGFETIRFDEVAGKTQNYLVAEIQRDTGQLKIYIYEAGAEFSAGKEWLICEKEDFRSSQELIEAFSQLLSNKIPPAAPSKS